MKVRINIWVAWWYNGDFDGGTEVFETEDEAERYLKQIKLERPTSTHMVTSVAKRFVVVDLPG